MYYSVGTVFERCKDGLYRMKHQDMRENVVIVSSEKLTCVLEDWVPVPNNHILSISPSQNVLVMPVHNV